MLCSCARGTPVAGDTWRVVRLGAEIGVRCTTCSRKVLLPRAEFERRVKRFVSRGQATLDADERG